MSNFTDIKLLHESGRAMNLSLNTKQSIYVFISMLLFLKISNKLPCMKYDLLFAVDLHVLTHCVRCKVVVLFKNINMLL